MKRGGSQLVIVSILAALAVLYSASVVGAVEVQLAGVRLDTPIVRLLTAPGWGEPDGIGPLARTAPGGAARATPVGGPGMGMRGGPAAGRFSGAAAARGGATEKGEMSGTQGLQYWIYKKQGNVKVVLGVDPSGNVATITVQGPSSLSIYTNRGIGLGDTFSDLVNAYGYPERTLPTGQGLQIAYPEQDVTFTLENLRVVEIAIGQPPAPPPTARRAATAARPAGATPRGPGMGGRPGGPGMQRMGMGGGAR